MLQGKKILLCVTGGIAVYKMCALTSKLTQKGAEVKVIMSESAMQFVSPLTFKALSKNEVFTDTFDEKDPKVIAHIDLADWADLILVGPATANIIGKLANGIADNMISTTLLAATAEVWIAPAMNVHMYDHPAVQKNIAVLYDYGYRFINPGEGYLACGYVGKGRLEEPEKIIEHMEAHFQGEKKLLEGQTVLVTAGPTREKIDPVRFVSNHSTGKMGYSIAKQAIKMGAKVILVTGPTHLTPPKEAEVFPVESAEEMYERVMENSNHADIIVKTAAVSDYKPVLAHEHKVKKKDGTEMIEFTRTKDILLELGKRKTNQVLVGFAAETQSVDEYAREKLNRKNADMIVANNITAAGAGFGTDTNLVTIYKRNGEKDELPLMTKDEVAKKILEQAYKIKEEI
ncbi:MULTISPECIES: bifunctional phosphopantothenoylcysteine decarboxylase/phosphopantothenate--cysteine ligase CoaBC [Bacillaceae]|uniref:bifunctional phosphopantothenoylcysteine decarboxylase/phosphopantothenate--cysteine ligase CoaBC n=1 Tax=Bacillaceae TaxID=186817 RepID=UPI001E4AB440|nr:MULTISPECIES: bifunctional phosphopantothenoylcysteine decarboxylase/phosphopantothenate--cysteine ligase CoaBC [Bacillaceae]MCE4048367.1 bifunctional phosphopantothenoylcysteine decarboxylase/phosphopantothenate--cysteine ligase CoaBC [Bacillus sp. Au-Bac7]MCM3029040.1 bifunctional phosphopantothenoylcysteine decarboxylase/phosphopantothenate--cysteine ligase CoaBC [Niallia sp. MER 6]MDL0435073.1 bifunctional phosphopantothenoylcysteine decarboxylase/phosphopantothenate--cysteine ligase CoaB